MNRKLKINSFSEKIVIFLMIISGCFRWFFNGFYFGMIGQISVLAIGIIILFLSKNVFVSRLSLIWILYLIAIFTSIVVHQQFDSSILFFVYIIELVIVLQTINAPLDTYKSIYKFIFIYGIINAIFVIIHFVFRDAFTTVLYSSMKDDAIGLASNYVRLGHYFGFFYTPSDPAGLISISAFSLLLDYVKRRENKERTKKTPIIFAILLFIPLLLTGKKGVLFISAIAFVLIVLIIYSSEKKMVKSLSFIIGFLIFIFVARIYITTHTDNELFRRLNMFFDNISTGEDYSSSRFTLWGYAVSEWTKNMVFGIGWRKFSNITYLIYGSAHEVNFDYLQILSETGLFGFILTIIPICCMAHRTYYVLKQTIKCIDIHQQLIVLCAAFYQFFFLLYAFIEVPFYDMTFFTLYILSCMIIDCTYKQLKKHNVKHRANNVTKLSLKNM